MIARCDVVRRMFDFFFQAEDGIRDRDVTGVQTCALPISLAAGDVHDAQPPLRLAEHAQQGPHLIELQVRRQRRPPLEIDATDRKSTRLNSSHITISYAVFCLKKKKKKINKNIKTHIKTIQ